MEQTFDKLLEENIVKYNIYKQVIQANRKKWYKLLTHINTCLNTSHPKMCIIKHVTNTSYNLKKILTNTSEQ